jgi:signal transduction histidine kinase
MKAHLSFYLLLITCFSAHGQSPLILRDSNNYYSISENTIRVYEDTTNAFKIGTEDSPDLFNNNPSFYFTAIHPKNTYWAKLNIIDSSDVSHRWFFVSYNYSIDSMDVFIYKKNELLFSKHYRFNTTKLSDKDVEHKNLVLDFPIPKKELLTVYIKVKNKNTGQYGFALREHKEYFSSSMYEYFFYGIFYGGLLMISLYHLIFFFSLRDYSYLFYSLYIIMQGIYMCYRDATALVFIFPDGPSMVDSTYPIVMFSLAVSVSLYSRFFLEMNNYRWNNFFIIAFVLFRIPFLFLSSYPAWLMWFDMTAALLPFIFSIISLVQGHKTAILFTISFGVIIIGYFVNLLWHANIIPGTQQIFYSLYYAVGIESLLLAFANAYRLRKLKEASLLKNILEEKVNHNIMEINRQKDLIKEKSDDLDMFLYRASHDIKGPLKSIDGLCMVGQMDDREKNVYFKRIASSSQRLQNILNSLLDIAKQNRTNLKLETIFLFPLVDECIKIHLREYPGFKNMDFKLNLPANTTIVSEKYSMLSIVQNIAENAIKYRDQEKQTNTLCISINRSDEYHQILFEDNGIGIDEYSLNKMFQMFYRANSESSDGAGLGLYIVKQNVERLGGKISISSKPKEFTRIEILLPSTYN